MSVLVIGDVESIWNIPRRVPVLCVLSSVVSTVNIEVNESGQCCRCGKTAAIAFVLMDFAHFSCSNSTGRRSKLSKGPSPFVLNLRFLTGIWRELRRKLCL